ncbi:MAG: metallophosphoesterase family protein [Candidatus Bathyarchaeia archaeon]
MVTQERQVFPRLQESLAKTVGVISDTHVPDRARRIPERVFKVFENVDFIVHAGDLVQFSVIDELERLAPVLLSGETWTDLKSEANCRSSIRSRFLIGE